MFGTKVRLVHRRIYAEGSAKTGVGIEEAFSKLAAAMVDEKDKDAMRRSNTGGREGGKKNEDDTRSCSIQ